MASSEGPDAGIDVTSQSSGIEYPVAGGGLYSTTSDYTKLLQALLQLVHTTEQAYPQNALLSQQSVNSLFEATLPHTALPGLAQVMNMRPPQSNDVAAAGEWDSSTGMVVWCPKDGRRLGMDETAAKGAQGRGAGSAGWFGAAGTMYFVDPKSNLTFVCTTQMLTGDHKTIAQMRYALEKQVYAVLQE